MAEEEKKYEILWTRHGAFQTTLTDAFRRRKPWHPKNPKEIRSFMPGSVIEFRVKVGDKVEAGDILMVYKAMKMNSLIKSPIAGIIKNIGVETDVNVPKDTLLIEFE